MKTTKAVLVEENIALRKQVSELTVDLSIKSIQYVNACEEIRVLKGGAAIPKFLRAPLPAHMQAAKDLAMKTGRVVKLVDEDFDARR